MKTDTASISCEHEARLTLARGHEHRDKLNGKNLYMLPALSPTDGAKEKQILKKTTRISG